MKKSGNSTEDLNNFYKHQLTPIVNAVKISLKKGARSRISKSAADVGAALTKGWEGLIAIQRGHDEVIKSAEKSEQEVYLRKSEGVVVKQTKGRAKEEESLFAQAARFFPGAEIMSSARIRKAAPSRLDISSINQQERLRGYDNRKLNPTMKEKILEQMTPQTRLRLREYEEKLTKEKDKERIIFLPNLSDPLHRKAYEACEATKWVVRDSEPPKSFKEIQTLYLKEGDALLQRIRPAEEKTLSEQQTLNLRNALTVPWTAVLPEILKRIFQGIKKAFRCLIFTNSET